MSTITPFTISIPDEKLQDLHRRLEETRLPGEIGGASWGAGPTEQYMREMISYLREGYDWREHERRLNARPHFMTEIDGQTFHFVHVKSARKDAVPLLLLHGWPGSFVEFMGVVDLLAETASGPAFDLVIPSLPGFGFSGPTREPGWNNGRIAAALIELMSRLGYERFGVQGGDAGAVIAPEIGRQAPERVIGIHVNAATLGFIPLGPIEPELLESLTDAEKARVQRLQRFMAEHFGFNAIQANRPQALAYALADSPAGLLAWISELFTGFGDRPSAVHRDALLTNLLIYWFTGAIGSSIRLYFENAHDPNAWAPKANSGVPTAVAVFPEGDVAIRRYAEEANTIARWTEMERGGHFAALEEPQLWAGDVKAFFSTLAA